jgi:hypothetical protein
MRKLLFLIVLLLPFQVTFAQQKDVKTACTILIQGDNKGIVNTGNNVTINNYFPTKMIEELNAKILSIMEIEARQNKNIQTILQKFNEIDEKYKKLNAKFDKVELFVEQIKLRQEQIILQTQVLNELPKKEDLQLLLVKNQLVVQGAEILAKDKKEDFVNDGGHYGFKELSVNANYVIVFDYKEGVAVAKRSNKFGFIDYKRSLVSDFKYDTLSSCSEGLLRAKRLMGGAWSFVDKTDKIVISETQLAGITYVWDFVFGAAKVLDSDKKYYFINKEAKNICQKKYDRLRDFNNFKLSVFRDGDYNMGFLNTEGKEIHRAQYYEIKFFDKLGFVRVKGYKSNRWGALNTLGTVILKEEYDDLTEFGKTPLGRLVGFKKNGQWGFYNFDEKRIVANPKYEQVSAFDNGGYSIITLNGREGLVDANDCQIVKPKFNKVEFLENGEIKVSITVYEKRKKKFPPWKKESVSITKTFYVRPFGNYGNCDLKCSQEGNECNEFKNLNK